MTKFGGNHMFKSYGDITKIENKSLAKESPMVKSILIREIPPQTASGVTIHQTMDYHRFHENIYNRDECSLLIKKLVKSMIKFGFNPARPIVVNDNNEILDGHHRFKAAKLLNIPIFYYISNTDTLESFIIQDEARKNWPNEQQLKFWTKNGVNTESYKFLFDMKEKYNIRWELVLEIGLGGRNSEICSKLKKGEWKLDRKNQLENFCTKFQILYDKMEELNIEEFKKFSSRYAAVAWNKLFLEPGFDFNRLLQQLKVYKNQLHPGQSGKTHLKNILHLYNYRRVNKIHFEDIKWYTRSSHS